MIIQLFAYVHRDPQHLLPSSIGREFNAAEGDSAKQRVICDYLASMTDGSLMATYERLMSPRAGSAFDQLYGLREWPNAMPTSAASARSNDLSAGWAPVWNTAAELGRAACRESMCR